MKRPNSAIKKASKDVRSWIIHLEKAIKNAAMYADLRNPETEDLDEEACEDCFGFDGDPLDDLIDLSQKMAEIAKEFPENGQRFL